MSRADTWAGSTQVNAQRGSVEARANDTARTIADRPTTIVITRDVAGNLTTTLPGQTVRLDISQNVRAANEMRDQNILMEITEQYLVVLGYKDHKYIPNTNLRRGDRFYHQGRIYEILELLDGIPGRLLASAKVKP